MKDVRTETEVPVCIAEKGVKLAKGRVGTFVAPSEPFVLELYLVELTLMERSPKPVDSAAIYVPLVLVPSSVNLVEIPRGDPSHTSGWLLANELGKEHIFE